MFISHWKEWYYYQHKLACLEDGEAFEDHIVKILSLHHRDYINPQPTGSFGDGGSDGLAERGNICYACYGQRAKQDAENKLALKIAGDFARAKESYEFFTIWRFVTNAPAGPKASTALVTIAREHGPESARPIDTELWTPQRIWDEICVQLPPEQLERIFPGAPGAVSPELQVLVPLLDNLRSRQASSLQPGAIGPVPDNKMEYNELPGRYRAEFAGGRTSAPRIAKWFAEQSQPDLEDEIALKFRDLYIEHRNVTPVPGEILERLYESLAGPNIRHNTELANAVYAVTAYFFDACHIFEKPPEDFEGAGNASAD